MHENRNSISMCLALDSDYLWNCCTCSRSSIEGLIPTQAFGDTFCKCSFYVSHHQFPHLHLNREVAVTQTGVVSVVLCGQWQCYSELCRCLQCQYLDVAAFFFQFLWSLPLSPPPPHPPRYMKICNTCLYHVEKLSKY